MRYLEGAYFLDENSRKSLNILSHIFEIIIITLDSFSKQKLEDGLNKIDLVLKVSFLSLQSPQKIDKIILANPLHDGEIKVAYYLKSLIETYDRSQFLEKILQDFVSYKFLIIPRAFFRFPKKIDLNIRNVNQEEYIDKKTGYIVLPLISINF